MSVRKRQQSENQSALTHKQIVGQNLRVMIAAVGLSPASAAREMGITPNKLGNWLRGDHYPDIFLVTRFAADHAAPLEMLFSGTAAYAAPALAAAYAEARRKLEAGARDA